MERIDSLIDLLNKANEAYYSGEDPIMTDYEYDKLYDELYELEEETGIHKNNSPTKNVGWHHVIDKIDEVPLNHPMLSLNKAHTPQELIDFIGGKPSYLSVKCDGLSCTLLYENGKFVSATTRGNGVNGSDVTNAARAIENIPMIIPYKDRFIVDGEVVIYKDDFNSINENLPDDKKFKNPRNLASGTLSTLDNQLVRDRKLSFIAWKVIEGFNDTDSNYIKLNRLLDLKFTVTPVLDIKMYFNTEYLLNDLMKIQEIAEESMIPYDGAVLAIDSISIGISLGRTEKFPRHSIAYKYEDELVETVLRDIEWNTSKSGAINPVAVFDDVEIDGTIVNRATLHNPTYIRQLQLGIGDTILVRKANSIIPRVEENLTRSNTYKMPTQCPSCGADVEVVKTTDKSSTLFCPNDFCNAKIVDKLVHFCSKEAMNIEGISEATMKILFNLGVVIEFEDIFELKQHRQVLEQLPGFGKKSVDKMLAAIEKSKNTTLQRFLYSLSIPLIGLKASKDISKFCNGNITKFLQTKPIAYKSIDGFGDSMVYELDKWMMNHFETVDRLLDYLVFEIPSVSNTNNSSGISGHTFVVTGTVNKFKNRKELQEKIESLGGKVSSAVSAKTSYLINNDISSSSSKNQAAKKLNIPIITEDQFLLMIGEGK